MNSFSKRVFMLAIMAPMVFSSCSKSDRVEPEVIPAAEYRIEDVRYFMGSDGKIDTTQVPLKDSIFYNSGSSVNVQKFVGDLKALNKISHFQITNLDALPKDVNLDDFLVSVPQNWSVENSYDLFPEPFPLNQQENQKPYNLESRSTEGVTFNIPSGSKMVVTYDIEAYHITCSFSAVLQNKMTGERYPLRGTWKGLLRYDNSQMKVTEYRL